jgi:gliding motility-associated-like protein
MKPFFLFLILCVSLQLTAQTSNLVASYSFENGDAAESNGSQSFDGFVSGNPQIACGVAGNSLLFDGVSDFITFAGPINELFERNDFVVAFYFHPTGVNPRQTLLRKKADCDTDDRLFTIDYLPNQGALEINFQENPSRSVGGPNNLIPLDLSRCWQHLAVERENNELRVFLNGERVARFSGPSRFNIGNNFNLEIARAGCPTSETNFQGFIDELNIFRGTIPLDTIESLFFAPDQIEDVAFPVVNLGTQVTLGVGNTCGNSFSWSPTASIVSGGDTPTPTVEPTGSTTYFVTIGFPNSGCRATDSVLLQVFDPESFDCTILLVPTAFTPNGLGPESNETLGISNAATLQEFEVFQVFDRWGNKVFETTDADGKWDGTYRGEASMPGVYVWHAAYSCNGESLNRNGSVKLIR